jgi:TolA-binding protein
MKSAVVSAHPFRARRLLGGCGAAAMMALAFAAMPAHAQDTDERRLKKVEAEVRALQRKVFGTSGGEYFAPEITAPTPTPGPASTTSTPMTDVLQRMDALEMQVRQLTGQVEQNTYRLGQIEARLEAGAAAAPPPAAAIPAPQTNLDAMSGGASRQPAAAQPGAAQPQPPAAPSAERLRNVQAVVKPQTDDPADDEYSYGFRLWDAKFYPEAQQQLRMFLEKYPKHRRASWARNLLGRAYLDDGNAVEAAKWFVQNYNTDPGGERAPDSLLYLAEAMKQIKDNKRACIALAEFSTRYAAEAAGRLSGAYGTIRNGLSCSA